MRHIAAYLLLRLGGNDAPDADAVTNVLTAVGVDADADAVAKVVADLSGKDLDALIAEGSKKLAAVPTGGGGGGGGGAGGAAAAEEVEEEKKEEEPEEEADVGGLFDSSGGDAAW
eukprot:CAMPEP_0195511286 /NCGR_PEP_ID=MMETSP0794_2-20130614/3662_1 /TAXON_ID=515487 /ORGANISM="Stephanopyxis turris, Strain CCMP 815" /LENGTH=114 /DNA_ID=CAMNT_0040638853 /DNA_START=95 /DNA_END=439 /DNA_ORIENTATION=+